MLLPLNARSTITALLRQTPQESVMPNATNMKLCQNCPPFKNKSELLIKIKVTAGVHLLEVLKFLYQCMHDGGIFKKEHILINIFSILQFVFRGH